MGRRILVTGLDSFWGGRVAQTLEANPGVDVIVGLGTGEPSVALERTEYVRSDQTYSILARIVKATKVDTIVHTFLVVDSNKIPPRNLHEINVIGTMNLLAAAGTSGSPVRQVVIKSATVVYGASSRDPTWFKEETPRSESHATTLERSLLEVESYVEDFANDNPNTIVTLLRFSNVVGSDIITPISTNLAKGIAPRISGFDPQLQFLEEDDVTRCMEFMTLNQIPGLYNVAGDGRVPYSEIISICNATSIPLPPYGTMLFARPLVKLGIMEFTPEMEALLRYGRGVDTRRLKETGFKLRYTTAGAVENFIRAVRLRKTIGGAKNSYTYQQDVENFFRHSRVVSQEQQDAP
ncbi:MAG: NAD-dependent epimerase/dehydratase family protein [Actinobacteria bacterium]|nr:NAD-dependent epimerase/dehydratase family protein [Actinomycetota bacterium]MCL6105428.1 NAD-dependent epimerase/dehydratase family protein [Actinomycetota bacterium]